MLENSFLNLIIKCPTNGKLEALNIYKFYVKKKLHNLIDDPREKYLLFLVFICMFEVT